MEGAIAELKALLAMEGSVQAKNVRKKHWRCSQTTKRQIDYTIIEPVNISEYMPNYQRASPAGDRDTKEVGSSIDPQSDLILQK